MKRKEKEELRSMSIDELTAKADEAGRQIAKARFELRMQKAKNTRMITNLRRRRAVILSILREKKIGVSMRKES